MSSINNTAGLTDAALQQLLQQQQQQQLQQQGILTNASTNSANKDDDNAAVPADKDPISFQIYYQQAVKSGAKPAEARAYAALKADPKDGTAKSATASSATGASTANTKDTVEPLAQPKAFYAAPSSSSALEPTGASTPSVQFSESDVTGTTNSSAVDAQTYYTYLVNNGVEPATAEEAATNLAANLTPSADGSVDGGTVGTISMPSTPDMLTEGDKQAVNTLTQALLADPSVASALASGTDSSASAATDGGAADAVSRTANLYTSLAAAPDMAADTQAVFASAASTLNTAASTLSAPAGLSLLATDTGSDQSTTASTLLNFLASNTADAAAPTDSEGNKLTTPGGGKQVSKASLNPMELVQMAMLQAAVEGQLDAKALGDEVQANTSLKASLRQQKEGVSSQLSAMNVSYSATVTNSGGSLPSGATALQSTYSFLSDGLDAAGDDSSILMIKLQTAAQIVTTFLQAASNVSKGVTDTTKAVIGNIGH